MRTLKIAGIIVLAVWMVWVSWKLLEIRSIAIATCGIVFADIEGWNLKNGHKPPAHPRECPLMVDLFHGP
jgi:hypothetical protein